MASRNTAKRFPDFSSSLKDELVEPPQKPQLYLDFSNLHNAHPTTVKPRELPPLPKLTVVSTPHDIQLHIQALENQIYQLCGATTKNFKPPTEQIDYINQEILTKKTIIDDLAEKLSIAREIHGQVSNAISDPMADTLEMLEFNFVDEAQFENE